MGTKLNLQISQQLFAKRWSWWNPFGYMQSFFFKLIYPAPIAFNIIELEEEGVWAFFKSFFFTDAAKKRRHQAQEDYKQACADYQASERYKFVTSFQFTMEEGMYEFDSNNKIDYRYFRKNSSEGQDPSTRKVIIFCGGNNDAYEFGFKEHSYLLEDNPEHDLLVFNPLGVGASTGRTRNPRDLDMALAAMIEHCVALGIPYENITVCGQSLGGAVATSTVNRFQQRDQRVKVIAIRSFASLDLVVKATFGKRIGRVLNTLISGLRLGLSSKPNFDAINKKNNGDAHAINTIHDHVIPISAQLAYNVKPKYRSWVTPFWVKPNDPLIYSCHCCDSRELLADGRLTLPQVINGVICKQSGKDAATSTEPATTRRSMIYTPRPAVRKLRAAYSADDGDSGYDADDEWEPETSCGL